jgi:hypothetical protein
MSKVTIPPLIYDSFFFAEKDAELHPDVGKTIYLQELFVHEIAFYCGLETIKPWEDRERFVPELFQEWERLYEELRKKFSKRSNGETVIPMKHGIGLFIECLYWSNGLPAKSIHCGQIDELAFKPVNCLERLQFLMRRPNIYPSFVQLSELFEEQKKQFAKILAIKNAKKQ